MFQMELGSNIFNGLGYTKTVTYNVCQTYHVQAHLFMNLKTYLYTYWGSQKNYYRYLHMLGNYCNFSRFYFKVEVPFKKIVFQNYPES